MKVIIFTQPTATQLKCAKHLADYKHFKLFIMTICSNVKVGQYTIDTSIYNTPAFVAQHNFDFGNGNTYVCMYGWDNTDQITEQSAIVAIWRIKQNSQTN